ncbi:MULTISPECIES: LuxR C-terminal-related transcriptional regulator [Actinomycetes]|uniref:LuxR C-terminal-related transcriptional regulator n=1 Tax=Actinomycetes TaxID=1760 RepID=UPI0009E0A88A|nr:MULTISPECIES: LuxR C-terminal-related transcriptional regulator [Actinomycetes]
MHTEQLAPMKPAILAMTERRRAPRLSNRELEVLRAWVLTDSKQAAASQLFITPATVNTHITRIRTKYADLGRPATTKATLLARAIQDGVINLDDL